MVAPTVLRHHRDKGVKYALHHESFIVLMYKLSGVFIMCDTL